MLFSLSSLISRYNLSFVLSLLFALLPLNAYAIQDDQNVDLFEFKSVEMQQRAITLAKSLRCPQCQNQNLVESNAYTAKALRLKVYEMVNEGHTDKEIKQYLVDRYGNIVLYDPPFNLSTALLWIFPGLFMILFLIISIKKLKR
ncbi:cytochrome c-type biogenesis protein CcmH [Vibrio rotiferianus]|jgi:cytochrome c-type biogenesis protein CcmH/NrfF|uniref:Cytochrome c-type biogenesis protein n=1 Tax=Vibrio rotiferianus TaxID=190895 RepID=A0A2K7SZC5_9VIBR|nr:cytochrome c-type biogenesis protein CcmH [Vibrio rotiferianus]NOH50782.1 cytochrome c-type biogenesis protein CcmH [Vibrio rotiferianus]OHY95736.1 cytochrome C nitrite reductase [Vibrio rotiferianus]CAH1537398.1 putative formate-dependent nitrite reductase complex subunit NrfF [Vibrio rotiferianus]CAH1582835.1 putative formate-dependent nitrite reductase complex subunit NrfF [Vibrio rotiferianus]